jgi:hypothetical protein
MNEYGLDANYFAEKLNLILRDVSRYTPAEMAREMDRLSVTADKSVLSEDEFKQSEWISADDEMPSIEMHQDEQIVLVSSASGDVDVAWLSRTGDRFLDEWRGVGIRYTVTHWMPLPKPPEAA